MAKMYTVFENTYFYYDLYTKKGEWVTELNFYEGDLTNVDTSTDWRFCRVEGKRHENKILGTVSSLKFPNQFKDIVLDSRIILSGYIMRDYSDQE